MEFTGERVIPGRTDPDLMNEHWARYAFAEALVGSKRVLDAGCGVGYGASRLAECAAQVIALDQAIEPLTTGGEEYPHPRLHFVQGDCMRFPLADDSLDAVVAFEVIEHLAEWKGLIEESRRVLKASGQFIVSTPNRLYYGESRDEPNPFHAHEFTYDEFREELGRCFPHVMLFVENHADALVFVGEEVEGIRSRLERANQAPDEAHFFLAVCSQQPLHGSPAFVYLPSSANVLREREKHIGRLQEHVSILQGEVSKRDEWLEAARVELDKFEEVQKSASKTIAQLETESIQLIGEAERRVIERTEWAQRLELELDGVRADREKCIQLIGEAERRVIERTEWAQRLELELDGVRADREKCIQLIGEAERRVIERTEWAQRLELELDGVRADREKCIQLIGEAERRVIERTEWAQGLDRELERLRGELEGARAELLTIRSSLAYRVGSRIGIMPEGVAAPAARDSGSEEERGSNGA